MAGAGAVQSGFMRGNSSSARARLPLERPMKRITTLLVAVAVATAMLSVPVRAEMAQQSTTDKVKTMTKEEWAKLRAEWKKDKTKFTACNTKSKADGLKGRKRWAA